MAVGPEEVHPDALMFGVVTINGKERPVLQRQATEEDACTECRGFGTHGMPLCGAVYACKACDGSGLRQPGQPPYIPPEIQLEATEKPKKKSWWRRIFRR